MSSPGGQWTWYWMTNVSTTLYVRADNAIFCWQMCWDSLGVGHFMRGKL